MRWSCERLLEETERREVRLRMGSGQWKSECRAFRALTKSSTRAARSLHKSHDKHKHIIPQLLLWKQINMNGYSGYFMRYSLTLEYSLNL